MGETIIDEYGEEWETVDEPYWTEDQIEEALAQREWEQAEAWENYLDHLEAVVAHGEHLKGRRFTNREMEQFVSDYIGDGLDENGRGDVQAAADTLSELSDLDDRDERRAYMSERLKEDSPSEIHSCRRTDDDSGDYYQDDE